VSVYAGVGPDTYFLHHLYPYQQRSETLRALLGNSGDFLAARVSYKLDLTGPSVNVQAGCSTSLVAVHLAVQSLLAGESDLALAGGSTVYFPPRAGYTYREGGMNSPDGRCRAFGADANGTTPGDGVAVLALRRLSDALASGDPVLGLILATAINNDGAAKAGFTAPSVDAQADVAAEALGMARLDPADIDYVEVHGTGTRMGDALEIAALTEGYAGAPAGQCRIGTSKPNVGDTWASAGAVSLVKVLLALEHEELPPTINCAEPNPDIDFAATPFRLNTELTAWKRGDRPRRAAVHTFGIGGTNAHVVLAEPPVRPPRDPAAPDTWQVLPLSARSAAALATVAEQLADHLAVRLGLPLADVAYTLRNGRRPFDHRAAVIARTVADAVLGLRALATDPGAAVWPGPRSLGELARRWIDGDNEAWQAIAAEPGRRVALPTYPFERRRYWVDPPRQAGGAEPVEALYPRPELAVAYAPPVTDLERLVAGAWNEALGIDGVGLHDSFFDLGGHSLIAARIISRVRQVLPVPVTVADLFGDPPTVAGLAARVQIRLHDKLATLTDDEAAVLAAELGTDPHRKPEDNPLWM
jgi:acyl transferase domain-containing protein